MSGRRISRMTRSGIDLTSSRAAKPVVHSSNSQSGLRKLREITYRFCSLSSTTRIRNATRANLLSNTSRLCNAQFSKGLQEQLGREPAGNVCFGDHFHVHVLKPYCVLMCEFLGCTNNHGQFAGFFSRAESPEHLESIHAGH